jgi:hypothetical protein
MSDYDEYMKQMQWIQNQKNSEYDWFEPFVEGSWSKFLFKPERYEIWEKGKMIKGGVIDGHIMGEPTDSFGNAKLEVTVAVPGLDDFIFPSFIFDVLFSQKDRLQLASIPPENPSESNGVASLRSVTGVTTPHGRKFSTEPYCGGLFFRDKCLVQVSFSFSSPNRLIEFHGPGITTINLQFPTNKG